MSGERTCSRWSSCTRSKLLVSIPIPARYAVNRASLPVPSAASTSVVVPFTAEGVEVESFSSSTSASELSSDGERVGMGFGSIESEGVAMASPLALEARSSEERSSGVRALERSKRERERVKRVVCERVAIRLTRV